MYNDYYLKFTDQAEAASVIGTKEIPNESPILYRDGCDISVIDVMVANTGHILTDEDGTQYYENIPIPGYHVNIRSTVEQPDLAAYDTAPTTPMRVWA